VILKTPYSSAPISPSFWNAKIQDLSFAKPINRNTLSNAHHVRIWRTKSLSKNGNHIYVGMANANEGIKWGVIPKLSPNIDVERELLYQALNLSEKIKSYQKEQLVKPQIGTNFTGDQFVTDGKAYIISVQ
jgi:undecaprenyl-diphosphatase